MSDYGTPVGGAEVQLLGLRTELRRRGHDARLFTSSAQPRGATRVEADYQCFGTVSRFRTLVQSANPSAPWHLRRVLREFHPHVVHVKLFLTQLSPLILPLLRRVPSIYHAAWYRAVCPLGTKTLPDGSKCRSPAGFACHRDGCLPLRDWVPLMIQMQLLRRWLPAFRLVIANSEATRQTLAAGGIQASAVIPHGSPVLPRRPPLGRHPVVGFAGRLVPEKGVDVLLRAVAEVLRTLPDTRLIIAGDGPERDRITRLIAELNMQGHVEMTGHLTREALARALEPAWVQAVPSRWAEPFGIVAIEALMRGTAVVASASGGLLDIVREGETGCFVPPGDAGALARALLPLLGNSAVAEDMGAAARRDALERFTEARFTDQFLEVYQRVILSRADASR